MTDGFLTISLVVPNYNSGPLLDRAVRSILDQGYPDLQLIVADAGSTDASRATIDRYRDHFAVVFGGPDGGQADGLNRGFRHASGDVHGWLCADDELLPGALHHVNDLFGRDPGLGVVTGACVRVFADGSTRVIPADPDPWATLPMQNRFEQPSTFWRGPLHKRVGPLDATYDLAFDWDLWNRFRLAGATVAATDRPLSRYHFSGTNKSGSAGRRHMAESFRVVRAYGPLLGRLAHVYRFLYLRFDLRGCYDNPPTCGLLRSHAFLWTLALLRLTIGKRRLYAYNWHFASCQERGLKWW